MCAGGKAGDWRCGRRLSDGKPSALDVVLELGAVLGFFSCEFMLPHPADEGTESGRHQAGLPFNISTRSATQVMRLSPSRDSEGENFALAVTGQRGQAMKG